MTGQGNDVEGSRLRPRRPSGRVVWGWRLGATLWVAATGVATWSVLDSTVGGWRAPLAVAALVLVTATGILVGLDSSSSYIPANVVREAGGLTSGSRRRAVRQALRQGRALDPLTRELAVATAFSRVGGAAVVLSGVAVLSQLVDTALDPTRWAGTATATLFAALLGGQLLHRWQLMLRAGRLPPAPAQHTVDDLTSRRRPGPG